MQDLTPDFDRAWHHHFGTRDYYAGLKRVIFHPVFFRLAPAAERQNAIAANVVGALGFCLILISIFALNRSVPYPGGWAVLPVAGGSW